MTSLDDKAEVGGQSTRIAGAGSLLIGVRSGHIVGKLSRSLEHLSLVVGTIRVFDFFRHYPRFVRSVGDTDEVAPSDTIQRVTSGTDLTINLVSSSDAAHVQLSRRGDAAENGTDYLA